MSSSPFQRHEINRIMNAKEEMWQAFLAIDEEMIDTIPRTFYLGGSFLFDLLRGDNPEAITSETQFDIIVQRGRNVVLKYQKNYKWKLLKNYSNSEKNISRHEIVKIAAIDEPTHIVLHDLPFPFEGSTPYHHQAVAIKIVANKNDQGFHVQEKTLTISPYQYYLIQDKILVPRSSISYSREKIFIEKGWKR